MTKVADFFQPIPDSYFPDPRFREWRSWIVDEGARAILEVHHWTGFALGHSQPELEVRFFQKEGAEFYAYSSGWDDALNNVLIDLKVRAKDVGQEADRFSLSLDTAFTPAECVAGDGFFNSVLFDTIRESELGENEVIANLLGANSVVTLDRQGSKYDRCRQLIDAAIRVRALELKDDLGYSMEEAWSILVDAVARYIDRRFSVSLRKQRGLV